MLKKLAIHGFTVANVGVIVMQILRVMPQSPRIVALQILIQAFWPSAFGVGHTLFFGGKQEDAPPSVKP